MFKNYESKPVTRQAHKILESDFFYKMDDMESTYELSIQKGTEPVRFKAYEPVSVGDYVVYLNDDDIYHCNAKVFAERNIIPEGEDA